MEICTVNNKLKKSVRWNSVYVAEYCITRKACIMIAKLILLRSDLPLCFDVNYVTLRGIACTVQAAI